LMVESTDAAYVSSRPPGCTLTVARQDTPVAEYRFVIPAASSRSRQRGLIQRLDSSVAALQQAAVIKRLYYKWWTSTACLAHFTDPNIWTPSVDRDAAAAADVDEKNSDDERIFLRSPLRQAGRLSTPPASNDRGGEMTSELMGEAGDVSGQLAGAAVCADNEDCQRHSTTTTTTTELVRRSRHKHDDGDVDAGERQSSSAEDDPLKWMFATRATWSHEEDESDGGVTLNATISDGVASEQLGIKEHWRSGGVKRQSQTRPRQASDRGESTAVSDRGGRVVSRAPSLTLMMMMFVAVRQLSRQ